jgi:hypothetical protein
VSKLPKARRSKAQLERLVELHRVAREVVGMTHRALKGVGPADYPALRRNLSAMDQLSHTLEDDDAQPQL